MGRVIKRELGDNCRKAPRYNNCSKNYILEEFDSHIRQVDQRAVDELGEKVIYALHTDSVGVNVRTSN